MEYENQVLRGACLEVLKDLPDNTFDAIVMDPPYGLGSKEPTVEEIVAYLQGADLDTGGDFMGKKWEIPSVPTWLELFRVLKPGGYVLTFGGTRTWDLISLGARAAGFEYRDTIADEYPSFPALQWMHGQGFPKSLNVSKAIDKDLGAEREVVGTYRVSGNALTPTKEKGGTYVTGAPNSPAGDLEITAAATDEAKHWEGWHTALKPAWEPILMYRKPLDGTVLQNIRKWGTGAINIDGCRVASAEQEHFRSSVKGRTGGAVVGADDREGAALGMFEPGRGFEPANHVGGRWPPNVVLSHAEGCKRAGTKRLRGSHAVAAEGKRLADKTYSTPMNTYSPLPDRPITSHVDEDGLETVEAWACVEGCPVRALDEQTGERPSTLTGRADPNAQHENPGNNGGASWFGGGNSQVYADSGGASRFFPQFKPFFYTGKATKREATLDGEIENNHPTKKPVALMAWLVKLVTPENGIVLDPYCGSGSTLHAACEEGFRFTGIERSPDFCETARQRMEVVHGRVQVREGQHDLFDLAADGDW